MKKLFFLPVLILMSMVTFAQANIESMVKVGSKLIYAVESGDQKYDFIVTVKKLVPAVEFDWEMTAPASISGTIIHTPQAMLTGNTMYNYFRPGSKTLDDNTLSVWLSKSTQAAFKKAGKGTLIKVQTDGEVKKMGIYGDEEEIKVTIDGEKDTVEELNAGVLNDQGEHVATDETFISFYASPKLPIILRMRNGFYIALKEIKTK